MDGRYIPFELPEVDPNWYKYKSLLFKDNFHSQAHFEGKFSDLQVVQHKREEPLMR